MTFCFIIYTKHYNFASKLKINVFIMTLQSTNIVTNLMSNNNQNQQQQGQEQNQGSPMLAV